MKKNLTMKRTLMAVIGSLLMFVGVNAQILTDYENVTETSYQTEGQTFRLYVRPDLVYSPSYDSTSNTGIDGSARWTWTYAGLTGDVASGSAVAQNYVEFTNPAVGSYTIDVVESNTIASCTGGTVSQDVNVVAAPVATITTADPAQACGNQSAMNVDMTFTENVPAAVAGYAFSVEELVENIDPSDAVLATISDNTSFIDFPTTGKLNTGNSLTGATSPYGYQFSTSALNVQNNLRTRYTYTLHKASDAPGAASDGVISAISQKSDYIAGTVTTYAFTDNQIVIVVNPSPTTGPIYHIPNNYAY